jgi:hypothetical protein
MMARRVKAVLWPLSPGGEKPVCTAGVAPRPPPAFNFPLQPQCSAHVKFV